MTSDVCLYHPTSVIPSAKVNEINKHKTRSSSSGTFYVKRLRMSHNQRLVHHDKFGQPPTMAFEKRIHNLLLSIMEAGPG